MKIWHKTRISNCIFSRSKEQAFARA